MTGLTKRASGVLMHISSLFGEYSIGNFGRSAAHFIDFLADCGFSYWQVETDIGEMDISLQDTYRSLNKIGGGRVIVTDMAGNRYEITDLDALDRKSRRKLELYL